MVNESSPPFSPSRERMVAVAYTPPALRSALRDLLALDYKLGRVLAQTSEPILAQLRLAWWRDRFRDPQSAGGDVDPLLVELRRSWSGETDALARLVDGWEALIGLAPLSADAISEFAGGREGAFAALARLCDAAQVDDAAGLAGRRWALADFAAQATDETERERALELGRGLPALPVRMPRSMRGVAILDGLSVRALAAAKPLLSGRRDALVAMRLGMTGR